MKIKKGLVLREVADSFVVVAVGEMAKTFNGMINLNETGAFLWRNLEKGCTKEELLTALTKEYAVEEEVASAHIDKFIKGLTEANLLD